MRQPTSTLESVLDLTTLPDGPAAHKDAQRSRTDTKAAYAQRSSFGVWSYLSNSIVFNNTMHFDTPLACIRELLNCCSQALEYVDFTVI